MPLLYARIVVDDKPGSLAAVTRGLAAAGADIVTVDVLGSEGGLAVDDFVLRVADGPLGAQVIRELAGLPGVAVESVRIARDAPDVRRTSMRWPGCSATRAVPCRPSSSGSRTCSAPTGRWGSCRSGRRGRRRGAVQERAPRRPSRPSRTVATAAGTRSWSATRRGRAR